MTVISDIEGAMSLEEAQELAAEIAEYTDEKLEIQQKHGHRHDWGPLKETDPYCVIIHEPHPTHRYLLKISNSRAQWEEFWKGEYVAAKLEAARPKQKSLL